MKKTNYLNVPFFSGLIFFLFFFTLTPANDFHFPSHSVPKVKKVMLKKNAKANGFKITYKSGKIYFVAIKVTDPGTKKLVEGEQKLEYRCKESDKLITVTLSFGEGNSASIQIPCTDLITPQIIIMEYRTNDPAAIGI